MGHLGEQEAHGRVSHSSRWSPNIQSVTKPRVALESRHPWAPIPSGLCHLIVMRPCCSAASFPEMGHFSCWVPSTVLLHPTAQAPNAGDSGASAFAALDPRLSKMTHLVHYQLLKWKQLGTGAAGSRRAPIAHALGGSQCSRVHPGEVPEPLEVYGDRTNISATVKGWIFFFFFFFK